MGIVIDNDGVINVAASTPGTYRITYTTAGTCPNSSFQDITINALPTITIAGSDFCAGQSTTLTATPSTGTFVWEVNTGSGFNVISGQSNNTISVSTAGDYRAKVTDANGCTSNYSTTLSITQFASPSVTISTVPGTTICSGDTATLTANPTGGSGSGYTYSWSTGAIIQAISVSPTTTTTYTVTVTDSNGCTATASQAITASTAGTTIASINNDDAMDINGVDQYIMSSGSNSSTNITISFWIKISETPTLSFGGLIAGQSGTTADYTGGFAISNSGGMFLQGVSGFGSYRIPWSDVVDGAWHHVALTRTNTNLYGYVDGTSAGSQLSSPSAAISSFDNIWIGCRSYNGTPTTYLSKPFSIDEVAIFNTALSSCDIKGIYDATTTVSGQPKTANLLDANTTIPAPVYWNRMGDS